MKIHHKVRSELIKHMADIMPNLTDEKVNLLTDDEVITYAIIIILLSVKK